MCSGESKVKSQIFKVEGKLSCNFEEVTFDFRVPIQVFSKIKSRFLIFQFVESHRVGETGRARRRKERVLGGSDHARMGHSRYRIRLARPLPPLVAQALGVAPAELTCILWRKPDSFFSSRSTTIHIRVLSPSMRGTIGHIVVLF